METRRPSNKMSTNHISCSTSFFATHTSAEWSRTIITARIRRMGKVMFLVCRHLGGTLARLGWGYPSQGWGNFLQRWVPPGQGCSTPLSRDGVPPANDGVPPWLEMGYPQPGMGYPHPKNGVLPWIRQQMEYLICGGWYASCFHEGLSCHQLYT